MLALHSFVISRFLPSSLFLVVAFCWLWVGASAVFDRLEAARAMAISMAAILLVVVVAMQIAGLGSGDMRAFYFLAMFPALTAWVCVCVFIHHIQRADDVTGRVLDTWFEEQGAARMDHAANSAELGLDFTEAMISCSDQDNERANNRTIKNVNPTQKAAS